MRGIHLELPELVRSRKDGAEVDGRCPARCVGRELRLPTSRGWGTSRSKEPLWGCLLPPARAGGGAQHQDSVLSVARRSNCMRTGVTKPADIKQGRGFTVPAKGVTMEGKGSSFSCRTDAAASQGVGSWHHFSVKSDS